MRLGRHPALRAAGLVVTCWALLAGCGDDDGSPPGGGPALEPCERYEALADSSGCDVSANSCTTDGIDWASIGECSSEFEAWIDCVEGDLDQCSCELDGQLNCEGSFKPDEGPALCIPEFEAFDACVGGA